MAGGRPKGSTKPKIMADALLVALNREAANGQTKKLALIAGKLVDLAESGDIQAIKEVFDRIDGKAVQAQILMGDEDGGPMRLEKIVREIVDPKDRNAESV